MKRLLVLRHAKSSWENPILSDFDRPLNDRGKRDAPRMGRLLSDEDLVPDLIITSAAKRAQKTAELVANNTGQDPKLEVTPDLYMAMPEDYVEILRHVPDTTSLVMVVGHNPGIEDFVEELIGHWERMPTAALAHIELAMNNWHSFDLDTPAKLLKIWLPKEL